MRDIKLKELWQKKALIDHVAKKTEEKWTANRHMQKKISGKISKFVRVIAVLITGTMLVSGCGSAQRTESTVSSSVSSGVIFTPEMDEIEDGGFYILRKDLKRYEKLYVKNANFKVHNNNSGASASRTLWFKDDFDKIPTMYEGDKLVYKTSDVLSENFSLERFAYVGYTVGITGLYKTKSGRFALSLDPDDLSINEDSDAKALYDLPTSSCIIDKIGGGFLRSGNISDGGCILGLEKGKVYAAEVYTGTFLNNCRLTADSLAMTSMEFYSTVDYDFMQSQIIEVHIPDYFNTGYYYINNYGLVRYVAGDSYNDETDFNIPNIKPEESNEQIESESSSDKSSAKYTKKITIEEDGNYTIEMTANGNIPNGAKSVQLLGIDKAYQLIRHDNSTYTRTMNLKVGKYTLEANGFGTATIHVTVQHNSSFVEDKQSTPDTSEKTTSTLSDTANVSETTEALNSSADVDGGSV